MARRRLFPSSERELTSHPPPPFPRPDSSQLVKGLEEARGNGTSMISLVIPPRAR